MSWKKVGNWFTSQAFAFLLIGIGLAVVVFALIAYGFRGLLFEPYIDPNISGQFGDFIGGVVGALWALAGVILFYLAFEKQKEAIEVQKDALEAQLEELRFTREELFETRKIFEQQSNTQQLMQFETSFYNLIELRQKSIDSFKIIRSEKVIKKESYWDESGEKPTFHPPETETINYEYTGREGIKQIILEARRREGTAINYFENFKVGLFK